MQFFKYNVNSSPIYYNEIDEIYYHIKNNIKYDIGDNIGDNISDNIHEPDIVNNGDKNKELDIKNIYNETSD